MPVGSWIPSSFTTVAHYLSPSQQTVTIPTGGTAVTFTWLALGTVRGTLTDPDGNPVGQSGCIYNPSTGWQCFDTHYVTIIPTAPQGTFSTWVYLDPAQPPSTVMLQFHSIEQGWNHRAYWGANGLFCNCGQSTAWDRLGDLPPTGEWVQLVVPISALGLSGLHVDGIAYSLQGGAAWWDDTTFTAADGTVMTIVDDSTPPGASLQSDTDGWTWVTDNVYSGTESHYAAPYAYAHQHYFTGMSPIDVGTAPPTYFVSTDATGAYSADVLPGSYEVIGPQVSPYGTPDPVAITATSLQTTTANLSYRVVGNVAGVVSDGSGHAISGASICDDLNECTTSGVGGAYVLHVTPGTRTIFGRYVADHTIPAAMAVGAVASGTTVQQDVVYLPNSTVTGSALDDQSAPVAGATLTFTYVDPNTSVTVATYTAVSGADGTFSLEVPVGTGWQVAVADNLTAYALHSSSSITVSSGASDLSVRYDRDGSLFGYLTDQDSNPVVGALVEMYWPYYSATSDASGKYLIPYVRPGTYAVYPRAITGYAPADGLYIAIPVGAAVQHDFAYQATGTITVTVRDDANALVPNADICLYGPRQSACQVTDAHWDLPGHASARDLHGLATGSRPLRRSRAVHAQPHRGRYRERDAAVRARRDHSRPGPQRERVSARRLGPRRERERQLCRNRDLHLRRPDAP